MRLSSTYSLPDDAHARLSGLVAGIEAAPGDLIRPGEFDSLQERLNARSVLSDLPPGLSDEDFTGILKLALLTECATESYAAVFEGQAERYDAPWLGRFTTHTWTPDELTHATPYKRILLDLGFAEAELDREIADTQESLYTHRGGDTPVHLTAFGMIQEYLTDNWHGLIANLMQRAAPEAAHMARRIKRRETLHTIWYRDMTALQIEANPRLTGHVGEALLAFQMPGNVLVPELQRAARRWLPLMGADLDRIGRDLVRLVHQAMGDVRRTGALLVQIAADRGESLGPIPARHIRTALDRLGGPGYGLLGEALLERAGLGYLFGAPAPAATAGPSLPVTPARLRGLLRTWLAERIELDLSLAAPRA